MNSPRVLLFCLIAGLVAAAGCKEEEQVPEHVLQRRKYEQRQRELRRQQEQEARQRAKQLAKAGPGAQPGPDRWSAEVRRAVLQVYRARGMQTTRAIQALAQLGPSAAAALRHIAGSAAMDERKQVLASLVLVELQMFQPEQLAELCRARELPFAQRAAVEALGRLGNPRAERLLRALTPALSRPPAQGAPAGRPGQGASPRQRRSLTQALRLAHDRSRKWWYSDQQLVTLDRVLQADSPDKLLAALSAVTDLTLDQGLRAILASTAARPPVKAAVAFRMVALTKDRPRALRAYCDRRQPPLLRMTAARRLLELGQRGFVEVLARRADDPLAAVWTQLLKTTPAPSGPGPRGR